MDGNQEEPKPSAEDTKAESAASRNNLSNLNPDLSKIIQPDYLQKQTPEATKDALEKAARYGFQQTTETPQAEQFDLNKVINFDALREMDIDSKEFQAKLDASAEKAKRYIYQRSVGVDGNPLRGEASELNDQSLKAEREALVETILARMSLGQTVTPELAIDVSMLGAAIDTKGSMPTGTVLTKDEVARKYAEIFANAVLQEPNTKGFDALTKINRRGEEYKSNPNISDQDTDEAQTQIRNELKQKEEVTSNTDKDEYVPMPNISQEIQDDPMFKSMREAHSLDYLKTKDAEWFKNQFPSDVLNGGFLTDKDGNKILPSNNLSGLPWNKVNRTALEEYAKLYPDKVDPSLLSPTTESVQSKENESVANMRRELSWYQAVGIEGHWAPDMPMGKAQMEAEGNLNLPEEQKDRLMSRYRMETLARALSASKEAIRQGVVVPDELAEALSKGIEDYANDFGKFESDYALVNNMVGRNPLLVGDVAEAVNKRRAEIAKASK